MRRENGRGLPLSSHFSLTVRGLCKHGMVGKLLRGKGRHINRVQSIIFKRSKFWPQSENWPSWRSRVRLGRYIVEFHYRTVLREKFKLSFQENLVTANKRSDNLYKTVAYCNRPLPNSKHPHFQNEAKCTTFLVKMSFVCTRMKNQHLTSF